MDSKRFIYFVIQCFVFYSAHNIFEKTTATFVHVNTAQGTVLGNRGVIQGTANLFNLFLGTPYYSFLGIPYAQPPVGQFRFKSALPPQPWTGIKEALLPPPRCFQLQQISIFESQSEDCLYINVYTPNLPQEGVELKSVMVYIHGGGFLLGDGYRMFGPDFLVSKDVILVTFNYRVGILGFLSLEDDILSGNFGLKDQVQALRWVQQNIASFGGNPNKVTIFGESAGGASVQYHLLSPLSKGLFVNAIVQSGSALNSWAFNPHPKASAIRLAKKMGFNSTNLFELYNFFLSEPASNLIKFGDELIAEELQDISSMNVGLFTPSAEVNGKVEKFITQSPRDILKSGNFTKVPLIMGAVNAEGILLLAMKQFSNNEFIKYNNIPDWAVPLNWKIEPGLERNQLSNSVKQFFFKGDPVSWSTINSLVDFFSDVYFTMDTQESLTAHLMQSNAPIYNYEFTFKVQLSGTFIASLYQGQLFLELNGASHGDELRLLFSSTDLIQLVPLSVQEKQMSNIMTTMWTNFAKTGNPNYSGLEVEWKPLTKDNRGYLNISSPMAYNQGKPQQDRLQFWKDSCHRTSTNYPCSYL